MRVLYHQTLCPFSRKIRFLLNEKKLDYVTQLIPFWEKNEKLFELNHALEVPILVDLNSKVIPDSGVIQEYIDEIYPEPSLIGPEKVETRRLANWFDHKFSREVSLPLINEKVFNRYRQKNTDTALIRKAKQNIESHLLYIGWLSERRNWLAGAEFSLADIAAAAHLSIVDYLGDIEWSICDEAKNWYMRVKSRPSFRTLLTDKIPGISPSPHYSDLDF